MMKVSEIVKFLENKYPTTNACDFDNGKIGLQFGSMSSDVKKVMLALDASTAVVNEAISKGVDLLIVHHPMLFNSILSINYDSPFGQKMVKVISNKLNVFSMHTNFDVADDGMNDILASLLNLSNIHKTEDIVSSKTLIRIGETDQTTLKEYVQKVKELLNEKSARYVGREDKKIKCVGIVGGAGASELMTAWKNGCDVLITGEVHHHVALEALDYGMAIIELSHSVERLYVNKVKNDLEKQFDGIEFIVSDNNINPFN